jgi:DNA (cytosine-5)-methyltransferase 1
VFVVGCLGGWESAAKVLFESESLSGNTKQSRKTKESVAGYVESSFGQYREDVIAGTTKASGGVLGGGSETFLTIPIHAQATQFKGGGENRNNDGKGNGLGVGKPGDPMNTLDTSSRHAVAYVADKCPTILSSAAGFSRPGNAVTEHETYVAYGFNTNARPDEMNFLDNQSNTLTTGQRAGVGCIGGQHPNAAIGEEICPTLTNAMGAGGGHIPIIGNMAVRRLTEVECERLQGFPDNYTNIKENCPSGARYKALGNSMAVPVMRWIGERINEYEQRGMA